jgi:hypothetical protein
MRGRVLVAVGMLALGAAGCAGGGAPRSSDATPRIGVSASALLHHANHCVTYDIQLFQGQGFATPGSGVQGVSPNGNLSLYEYAGTLFCNPDPTTTPDTMIEYTINVWDNCVNGVPQSPGSNNIYTATNVSFQDCPQSIFNPQTGLNEIHEVNDSTRFLVRDERPGPGGIDVDVVAQDIYEYCKVENGQTAAGTNFAIIGAAARYDAIDGTPANALKASAFGIFTPWNEQWQDLLGYFQLPDNIQGQWASSFVRWNNPGFEFDFFGKQFTFYDSDKIDDTFYARQNAFVTEPRVGYAAGEPGTPGGPFKNCRSERNLAVFYAKDMAAPEYYVEFAGGIRLEPGTPSLVTIDYVRAASGGSAQIAEGFVPANENKLQYRATEGKEVTYSYDGILSAVGAFFARGGKIYLVFSTPDRQMLAAQCFVNAKENPLAPWCLKDEGGNLLLVQVQRPQQ